jgi:hypothetical protein
MRRDHGSKKESGFQEEEGSSKEKVTRVCVFSAHIASRFTTFL